MPAEPKQAAVLARDELGHTASSTLQSEGVAALGAAVLERPDSGVLAAVVVVDTVLHAKEL
jgi:hypothetical protein